MNFIKKVLGYGGDNEEQNDQIEEKNESEGEEEEIGEQAGNGEETERKDSKEKSNELPTILHRFPINNVRSLCFSPDETKLATGSDDEKVRIIDLATKETISVFSGHYHTIHSVDFTPDGRFLASGSLDKTIRLWNVEDGSFHQFTEKHDSHVNCVKFSGDGEMLITGGSDYVIKIWNPERKTSSCQLKYSSGHIGWVQEVDILPDNVTLASGHVTYGHDGGAALWDLRTQKSVQKVGDVCGDVFGLQFHPTSPFFLACAVNNTMKIIDIRTNRIFQDYEVEEDTDETVYTVCFHPKRGTHLLAGSKEWNIKLYNLVEKKVTYTMNDHRDRVLSMQFSPVTGKYFASGGLGTDRFLLWNSNIRDDEEERKRTERTDSGERTAFLKGEEGTEFVVGVGERKISIFSKMLLLD